MNEELKIRLSNEILDEGFSPEFLKFLEIEYCLDMDEIEELVEMAEFIQTFS